MFSIYKEKIFHMTIYKVNKSVSKETGASDKKDLHHLLPIGYKLELHSPTRTVSILSTTTLSLLNQQQFTKNEWSVFQTLLSFYPHYAPHEALLASVTLLSIDDCRRHLHQAQQAGPQQLKNELKPVYRAQLGIRTKLQHLSPYLKIALVRNLGYMLTTIANESPCPA
jgi:hypothetical protein